MVYGGSSYGTTSYDGGDDTPPRDAAVTGAGAVVAPAATAAGEGTAGSEAARVVGADSRRKIRIQALGRVDEFAREILLTRTDEQAREAADLALLATNALARYVDDTPADPRIVAWAKVLSAAGDLLPENVRKGAVVVRALRDLARAYGLPWDFRAGDQRHDP